MLLWLVPLALVALYLRFPFFLQDVRHIYSRLTARRKVTKYVKTNYTVLDRFADLVQSQPNKPLLLFRDETFTYRDADELSNQTGRVLLQGGRLRQGDTVALFVVNEPMFMWLWLGLVKVGCSAAFLNSNIRSRSLLHSFTLSGASTLLVSAGELCRTGPGVQTFKVSEEVCNHLTSKNKSVLLMIYFCFSLSFSKFTYSNLWN